MMTILHYSTILYCQNAQILVKMHKSNDFITKLLIYLDGTADKIEKLTE